MPDIRSTIDAIKKRKQAIDEAAGMSDTSSSRGTQNSPIDSTDLLSDAAIDAELKRRKAAQSKKGWLW